MVASRSSRALWTAKLTGKPLPGGRGDSSIVSPCRKMLAGVVVGIDPSLRGTGLARIECDGKGKFLLTHAQRVGISPKMPVHEALGEIFRAVTALVEGTLNAHVAVEQTIFVQNYRTAHTLGAARGAALAAAALKGCLVHEYAPLRIKQAVTGFGRASKGQMIAMMESLLGVKTLCADEADAAAVALCHALTVKSS